MKFYVSTTKSSYPLLWIARKKQQAVLVTEIGTKDRPWPSVYHREDFPTETHHQITTARARKLHGEENWKHLMEHLKTR